MATSYSIKGCLKEAVENGPIIVRRLCLNPSQIVAFSKVIASSNVRISLRLQTFKSPDLEEIPPAWFLPSYIYRSESLRHFWVFLKGEKHFFSHTDIKIREMLTDEA